MDGQETLWTQIRERTGQNFKLSKGSYQRPYWFEKKFDRLLEQTHIKCY